MRVVVVGAGVIGLTTAVLLQEQGFETIIVANSSPLTGDNPQADYASREAGAHWCSFITDPSQDIQLQEWERISLKYFYHLAEHVPESGVMKLPCHCFYASPHPFPNPWFKKVVENFSLLPVLRFPFPPAPLHSSSFKTTAFSFTTVTINVPQYLRYLLSLFYRLGGVLHHDHISSLHQLQTYNPDLIVNCTGLGTGNLTDVSDDKMVPIRGYTVLIRHSGIKKSVTRRIDCNGDVDVTYVIPRCDGTVVLGGTMEPYQTDMDVTKSKNIAGTILKKCRELVPKLTGKEEILRFGVGLRPARLNGIRMEEEVGDNDFILHLYGHGGYGFQSSWGCCIDAVRLVNSILSKQKRL